MNKSYQYYAEYIISLSVTNPHVDESNMDEVLEYTEELAAQLVLDPNLLKNAVEKQNYHANGQTFA